MSALHTAGTGMRIQQMKVDVIANNLANANTTGFKRTQMDFQDLLYQNLQRPGLETATGQQAPTGLQVGSGARVVSTTKVFAQGGLEETSRDLDVALQGQGFFQVSLPDGSTGYTRDGSFRMSDTGALVTAEGYAVSPQITIPPNTLSIQIGKDGGVSVLTADSPETATQVGTITLARFPNPAGLSSEGGNLLRATPSSGQPVVAQPGADGMASLVQRFKERSNVDVVTELVNLITAQRAYEVNSRAIRTSDEMLAQVSNLTR